MLTEGMHLYSRVFILHGLPPKQIFEFEEGTLNKVENTLAF